jgi:LysM repeat protein
MPKSLVIATSFFLVAALSFAQTKTHKVRKGENVYRISLKYGVSMESIFQANPGSREMIRAGESLTIPSGSQTTKKSSSSQGTYLVKRGDTKYGLSKKFGLSIKELEAQNPQIVRGLQAGHVLKIPDNKVAQATNSASGQTQKGTYVINKGETIWGISQTYGLTIQEVLNANPGIKVRNLQIGQIINLPGSEPKVSQADSYVVKAGDTKFGLSQKFSLSIAELEALNPQIVDGLYEGQLLKLEGQPSDTASPTVADNTTTEENDNESSKLSSEAYTNYVIQPKETLYSLSRKAGLSIEAFQDLNPQLRQGVVEGTVVKMPVTKTDQDTVTSSTEIIEVVETAPEVVSVSLMSETDKSLEKKVIWLLPETTDLLQDEKTSKVPLDHYRGGHMAIEDLKSKGFKIEETIIDVSSKSKKELQELSENTDVLIATGPLNNSLDDIQLKDNATVLNLSNQPVGTETLTLNPVVSYERQVKRLFDHIASKNGNVIVLNDTKKEEEENMVKELYPDARFITVKSNDSFDENALISALVKSKLNVIVINSEGASLFLNSTNILLRQYANYDLQLAVLDPALIPASDQISDKRFRILNLMFPTVIALDKDATESGFSKEYSEEFGNPPSVFAYTGYDATYDAMLRMFNKEGIDASLNLKNNSGNFRQIDYLKKTNNTISNDTVYLYKYGSESGFEKIE